MTAVQASKAFLHNCTIGDWPALNGAENNFHVHEIRIYEDHCKPYLTGQLVIETYQNIYEHFLKPAVEVLVDFESPATPQSGYKTKRYTEKFRVFSYESKASPQGQAGGRMIHTLSLIGHEYYNDKHNTVIQNDHSVPGTTVAQRISDRYVKEFGASTVVPVPSSGPIGLPLKPNQTFNVRPIKAIHDLIDNCVWSGKYKTCAPVYFRRKQGHVIAPMQYMLEDTPVKHWFSHRMGQGGTIDTAFEAGYNLCIAVRPISPSGEIASGVKAGVVGESNQVASSLDMLTGLTNKGLKAQVASGLKIFQAAGVKTTMEKLTKSKLGSRHILGTIDSALRPAATSKQGPGKYNTSQAALVTALTLSAKYWVSVPGQSGNHVTAGDRIQVEMPVPIGGGKFNMVTKTLYVARLIHEVIFTDIQTRKQLDLNAKTDMFCVDWRG